MTAVGGTGTVARKGLMEAETSHPAAPPAPLPPTGAALIPHFIILSRKGLTRIIGSSSSRWPLQGSNPQLGVISNDVLSTEAAKEDLGTVLGFGKRESSCAQGR